MTSTTLTTSERLSENARYRKIVPAGDSWIYRIAKWQTFRLVEILISKANQAVDTLFYNADNITDRYDFQATIRAQSNIYLTTGTTLMTARGTRLLTIKADTCGRHDTLGGACATESNQVRYALDKKHMHACRQSFLKAVLDQPDFGITKRDIANNINFFMNVPVSAGEAS